MIFYFSGTGNSRWVATYLRDTLHEKMYAISEIFDKNIKYTLKEGEKVGFVFPVYAWGPPPFILEFIASLHFISDPEYIYFVCTCGDDVGKTADIFQGAIRKRGWMCNTGFSVIMPNTYVCLPGFDIDSLTIAIEKKQKAVIRMKDIVHRLAVCEKTVDCHEGSMPRLKSYVLRPFFHRFLMSAKSFCVSESCISCGMCEKICPVSNIHLSSGRPYWGNQCTMCLACYHHCPKHAIQYGRQTKNKGQYIFDSVEKNSGE